MRTNLVKGMLIILIFLLSAGNLSAHCDTMDGPVVSDARKALEENNVNYVLKWVKPEYEKEIVDAFNIASSVRKQNTESGVLADMYFFEKVVRLHRMGEGVAFTGIRPSGSPVDEKILAADKSIETGDLNFLSKLLPVDELQELEGKFSRVISLKNFDVNDINAGREYIDAYVQFFHFAEGEEHNPSHNEGTGEVHHEKILPWITTAFFFITTVILFIMLLKKNDIRKAGNMPE